MALKTLGTAAQTTLTAMPFGTDPAIADIATLSNLIVSDTVNKPTRGHGYWSNTGLLILPGNRGIIQAKVGDWIGVDANGWPILITKNAAASASWIHT